MKSFKYSLFLSVASVCMLSSTLVADGSVLAATGPVVAAPALVSGQVKVDQPVNPQAVGATTQVIANPAVVNNVAATPAAVKGKKPKLTQAEIDKLKAEGQARKAVEKAANMASSVVPAGNELIMPNLFETDPLATSTSVVPAAVTPAPTTAPTLVTPAAPVAPIASAVTDLNAVIQQQSPVVPAAVTLAPTTAPTLVTSAAPVAPIAPAVTDLNAVIQQQSPVVPAAVTIAPTTAPTLVTPAAPVATPAVTDLSAAVQQQSPVVLSNVVATAPTIAPTLVTPIAPVATPAVVDLNSTVPTIDPNAEKAKTVAEVTNALTTPEAEKIVEKLVERELKKQESQKDLVNIDLSADSATPAPVTLIAKPAKQTLTPEQALALASAKEKQAKGEMLTAEEQGALDAVAAIRAAKAQRRAAALAPVATVKVNKRPKGLLTPVQAAALKAKKRGDVLTQAQEVDYTAALAAIENAKKAKADAKAATPVVPAEEVIPDLSLIGLPDNTVAPAPTVPVATDLVVPVTDTINVHTSQQSGTNAVTTKQDPLDRVLRATIVVKDGVPNMELTEALNVPMPMVKTTDASHGANAAATHNTQQPDVKVEEKKDGAKVTPDAAAKVVEAGKEVKVEAEATTDTSHDSAGNTTKVEEKKEGVKTN